VLVCLWKGLRLAEAVFSLRPWVQPTTSWTSANQILGVGTGRSRLRGAGGPISISQGGKGAKTANTHRHAKNARSLKNNTDANNKNENCERIQNANGQSLGVKLCRTREKI